MAQEQKKPEKCLPDAGAVAVLGASSKPERYSFKAVMMLKDKGYAVFPVHPAISEIHGIKVYKCLSDIPEPLDTITVYVSPDRSDAMKDEILKVRPRRIIFNPGAENSGLSEELCSHGIEILNACTLVMLTTGQFDKKIHADGMKKT